MLVFPLIGIAVVAAVLSWGSALFIPAAVVAVLSFWSHGVVANFVRKPRAARNWATVVSFFSTVAAVVLIVLALVGVG